MHGEKWMVSQVKILWWVKSCTWDNCRFSEFHIPHIRLEAESTGELEIWQDRGCFYPWLLTHRSLKLYHFQRQTIWLFSKTKQKQVAILTIPGLPQRYQIILCKKPCLDGGWYWSQRKMGHCCRKRWHRVLCWKRTWKRSYCKFDARWLELTNCIRFLVLKMCYRSCRWNDGLLAKHAPSD